MRPYPGDYGYFGIYIHYAELSSNQRCCCQPF